MGIKIFILSVISAMCIMWYPFRDEFPKVWRGAIHIIKVMGFWPTIIILIVVIVLIIVVYTDSKDNSEV